MSKSVTDPSLKAAYVLQFIVLTLVSFGLYSAAPWMIALALNGPVQLSDLFRTAVPAVDNATMWNGKLCLPQAEVDFFKIFGPGGVTQSLALIDIDTKETSEIRTRMPPGSVMLVPDGNVLWGLSGSTVYRVENGTVKETGTGTTLSMQESAFLYEGKLTVIEEVHNRVDNTSQFRLLVWSDAGWQDRGRVLLPGVGSDEVDEVSVESQDENADLKAQLSFQGPVEIRVLNENGKLHLFCSDGANVLYSDRLEILTDDAPSALVAENKTSPLPGWLHVGAHSEFQVALDSQGPMLVEQKSDFRNGAMTTEIVLKRFVDRKWIADRSWERKGFLIEPQLISDGKRVWIVGQTFANKMSLSEITATGTEETKLPLAVGATLDKMTLTAQEHAWWAPIPIMVVYAMAASWLMSKYRNNVYEFGNATVEFASFGRRSLAKMFDWLLSTIPMLVVQWVVIGSQADMQEWVTDQFMNFDLELIQRALLVMLGFVVYCLVWLIVLSVMEGIWGVSPGKLLFGIRVVRTTLRPCGFFRALVREVMLAVDGLFCMGWLPGAFCVGLTKCWQRLGDMVGDTIVIRKPGSEQMKEDDVFILDSETAVP